jgi:3-isopropylmalate dehydrogenase
MVTLPKRLTHLTVACLPGDGIGPEVIAQGVALLNAMAQREGFTLTLTEALIGGVAVEATGSPLPEATLALARQADAVLLGAVGGPAYDTLPREQRPEMGLLGLRKALGLYANLRPVVLFEPLLNTSSLKPEVLRGVDMMMVRELTGGLYFGQPKVKTADSATDTMTYTRAEVERIAHLAFNLAQQRRGAVCSVDKANVLMTSQLWREVVSELGQQHYPEVALTHQYVDNAAMQLIRQPAQYDVLLTENTFGDILSDEASMLAGSLGMLPSASLGDTPQARGQRVGLYEPSHGSAPDIAGQDKANPIATLLSVKWLLTLSAGLPPQATQCIDDAIHNVLAQGYRTADMAQPGDNVIGCRAMGQRILDALAAIPVATAPVSA